ncbi:AraC family transcriptional regulator [Scytonema hofmannii PCC 7110]|uniref:AraC family transcriptional regulator n=1 Tax=Scytonema hofmannii PCC 7110 TaxID=128403 RepID=A0A139WZF2_9CYAN|nr:AraC family transcriptional regulator [Scytonema hofmannii]KYC37829.1 AraC family transcriptional regulator [Scytonema hofmannii PCC 7110]
MSEQALVIDHLQKDSTLPVMPNPPLWTSHDSGWNNIHVAHFRQPALELPEFTSLQHIITAVVPPQTVKVEFVFEGRLQTVQYYPSDYIDNCVEIFPASQDCKICWDKEIEFTHFYLEPTFVSHVAHEAIDPDCVEILFEPKIQDFLIYQICLALKSDLDVHGSGTGFYADSMATALSAHLLRHYSTREHKLREYEDGLPKDKLKQAIEYINEHLTDKEKLSLEKIATKLNISHYYFCRLFKQSTGMAPHQYLIQQRVERAKQLLKHTKRTVTDVAIECGFANQSHFAKHFRQHTGVTPKEFRKM